MHSRLMNLALVAGALFATSGAADAQVVIVSEPSQTVTQHTQWNGTELVHFSGTVTTNGLVSIECCVYDPWTNTLWNHFPSCDRGGNFYADVVLWDYPYTGLGTMNLNYWVSVSYFNQDNVISPDPMGWFPYDSP